MTEERLIEEGVCPSCQSTRMFSYQKIYNNEFNYAVRCNTCGVNYFVEVEERIIRSERRDS